MKEKKDKQINVRLNESQIEYLQQLVLQGKAKTVSGALLYLINKEAILGTNQ